MKRTNGKPGQIEAGEPVPPARGQTDEECDVEMGVADKAIKKTKGKPELIDDDEPPCLFPALVNEMDGSKRKNKTKKRLNGSPKNVDAMNQLTDPGTRDSQRDGQQQHPAEVATGPNSDETIRTPVPTLEATLVQSAEAILITQNETNDAPRLSEPHVYEASLVSEQTPWWKRHKKYLTFFLIIVILVALAVMGTMLGSQGGNNQSDTMQSHTSESTSSFPSNNSSPSQEVFSDNPSTNKPTDAPTPTKKSTDAPTTSPVKKPTEHPTHVELPQIHFPPPDEFRHIRSSSKNDMCLTMNGSVNSDIYVGKACAADWENHHQEWKFEPSGLIQSHYHREHCIGLYYMWNSTWQLQLQTCSDDNEGQKWIMGERGPIYSVGASVDQLMCASLDKLDAYESVTLKPCGENGVHQEFIFG